MSARERYRGEVFQTVGKKGFERHGRSPVCERALTVGLTYQPVDLIVGIYAIGNTYAAMQHD
jgi:hypothetical protein